MRKEKKKRLRRLRERRERQTLNGPELTGAEWTGVLKMAGGGFGFVKVDTEQEMPDVFIPVKYLGGALDGDTVRIRPLPPRRGDPGPAGAVVAVVKAARESAVGEVLPGGMVRPLNRRVGGDFPLVGGRKGARIGDWVHFKLLRDPAGNRAGIAGVIGAAGSIRGDLDAVCQEFDLPPPYTGEENRAAALLEPEPVPREDFTGRYCMTIDPADAKDYDDAVSIAPGNDRNTWEIGVHIADVAAFVPHGSVFDRAAAERAFTAYLPGRTLPMLPAALTSKISLHEGGDCPAHSVILQVERSTGRVLESRRCHTTIRVRHRLHYDAVQQFLEHGRDNGGWPDEACEKLKLLAQITGMMRQRRLAAEKVIDLALPEVRLICDENADQIRGISVREPRTAEQIVEECMLAANSAVGAELQRLGIPGVYRVHEEPTPEKLEEFSAMAESDFGIATGDLTNRSNMLVFIARLPEGPLRPLLLGYLLRAMPHARYRELPELHYGLGKTGYCHFTSPIRRYTDLTVHQQLWNFDQNRRTRGQSAMARLAVSCSLKEENNDSAYFAACDRLKLRYLMECQERDPEKCYQGLVVRIIPAGLVVDLPELGMHGFVPKPRYSPSSGFRRRQLDIADTAGYNCGDPVLLRLTGIDPVRNSAEFCAVRNRRDQRNPKLNT
ncbi:MAG: VacB/RNase II family 3'-5' exoribonuclease [Lentisphaeria bacterium]|nr:VacB/RNase II family 3'-5' exoribonuclease [Lentisphaeria bacterium]